MSTTETKFIQWIGSIVAVLIAGILLQAFVLLSTVDVIEVKIQQNEKAITQTKTAHEKDVKTINRYMYDIRTDQQIIKADIKELLQK